MKYKVVTGIMLTLLFISMLTLAFNAYVTYASVEVLWEKNIDGIYEIRDVKVVDIGGDGFYDVIVGVGGKSVLAFDGLGNSLWNFSIEETVVTLEIGDVNNDGLDDLIIYATYGWVRGPPGYVGTDAYLYAIDNSGTLMWKRFLSNKTSGGGREVFAVGDINGDGKNEIVADAFRKIVVFDLSGNEIWNFSLGSNIGNIKVSDIDNDEKKDVVATYWTDLYRGGIIAFNGSGVPLWDYHTYVGMDALEIADVNGDERNEIIAASASTLGLLKGVYLVDGSGEPIWYKQFGHLTREFVVGDIDGDGLNDIVGGTDGSDVEPEVYAINGSGISLWSYDLGTTPMSNVAIGDFDGDRRKNDVAFCGAYYQIYPDCKGVWALNSDGDMILEFSVGSNFLSLAVGDLNQDNIDDIVASSSGKIYVLTPQICALTINSPSSGVTFTVDGVSHVTPWSGTYSEGSSVSLVMPETHTVGDARYYWDQWSDGNTSRSRTVTMNTNITFTAYFTGPYCLADVNGDGIVDISDVVIVALCFGSTVAEPNIVGYPYDPRADLNNDGLIDICDLVIIGVNFGKTV